MSGKAPEAAPTLASQADVSASKPTHCPDCNVPLLGPYCHACGQHVDARVTLHSFMRDVRKRVFRADAAFGRTLWDLVRDPRTLVRNYLAGLRQGRFDPIQFFISSVFVQVLVATLTQAVAPLLQRLSALHWLSRLGGMVAIKILIIFWMGTLWRLLFRKGPYNLGEIFVFATYAFGTTNLLWSLLPLIDLILPLPLGDNPALVTYTTVGIECAYLVYAVHSFSQLSWWRSAVRVVGVLAIGYALLAALVGLEQSINLVVPLMAPS